MKNAHRKARTIKRIPPSSAGSTVALPDEPLDADEPLTPATSDQEPATRKLPLTLTNDGRIDVPRLREKTRDALRHALSDPELPVALGINSTGAPASREDAAMLAELTTSLFTGVSAVSAMIAVRAGFKPEHAVHMVWSEDEINAAAPLTSKIAAKRLLPLIGEEYRDEIMLGYIMLSIIGKKIVLMREAAKLPPHAQPLTDHAS